MQDVSSISRCTGSSVRIGRDGEVGWRWGLYSTTPPHQPLALPSTTSYLIFTDPGPWKRKRKNRALATRWLTFEWSGKCYARSLAHSFTMLAILSCPILPRYSTLQYMTYDSLPRFTTSYPLHPQPPVSNPSTVSKAAQHANKIQESKPSSNPPTQFKPNKTPQKPNAARSLSRSFSFSSQLISSHQHREIRKTLKHHRSRSLFFQHF